jgi:hypothetical protein
MLASPNFAGRPVWFTGHSLGAALATLAAHRCATTAGIYTFGSPRVADQGFASNFNNRFAGKSFRIVNGTDVVTTIPLDVPDPVGIIRMFTKHNYRHVAAGMQIDDSGRITPSESGASLAELAARMGSQVVANLAALRAGQLGQLQELPPYLLDHTPRRYAVQVWNDLLG